MKTPHPYAEILRAIADGETVQWKYDGPEWEVRTSSCVLEDICLLRVPPDRYRIKPRTIRVGEVDVPEPMREAPEVGRVYFFIQMSSCTFCESDRFTDHPVDHERLKRGFCFANREDAETAGRAIAALFAKDKP